MKSRVHPKYKTKYHVGNWQTTERWSSEVISPCGTDAPICQDGRSGRQVCGLARSVVCHHALKDLAGEKAFKTADDLPFGPPFSGASFDVVEGWCVELHPHDDGPVRWPRFIGQVGG